MEKKSGLKRMDAFHSKTLRGIIAGANERGLQKEDIVQILPSNEGFMLIFYV